MGKGTGGVVDVVLGRRYTRIPDSPPPSEGHPNIFFFFYIRPTCKILSLTFGILFSYFLFLTFVLNMVISPLHVYSFPLFPCFWPSRAWP